MNERQRKVLIGVAVATVLLVLFPPFEYHMSGEMGARGYHLIWSHVCNVCSVNLALLLTELLAVWVVGALLWLVLAGENASEAGGRGHSEGGHDEAAENEKL